MFRWLCDHPQVAMPRSKELRFFDRYYDRGLDWYRDQLPELDDGVVGEATPRYLHRHVAAERIARDLPGVRMIFCLREPAERAYSHYWMARGLDNERRRFADVLDDADMRHRYVRPGRYARHLREYLDRLGEEHVLVLLFDDLVAEPGAVLRRTCAFLGVDPTVVPESVGVRVDPGGAFRSVRLRQVTKRWPGPLRDALGRWNRREQRRPPMAADVRERLREHFAPHDAALAQILGRSLPW